MSQYKTVLLPPGIKTIGDIMDSFEFKNFVESEIEKSKAQERLNSIKTFFGIPVKGKCSIILGAKQGRSLIGEYINTLPEVTEEDMMSGKCDGRTIMSYEL